MKKGGRISLIYCLGKVRGCVESIMSSRVSSRSSLVSSLSSRRSRLVAHVSSLSSRRSNPRTTPHTNLRSTTQTPPRSLLGSLRSRSDGLGYNLGRTHINSCDFSTDSYSFSSTPNDFNLTSFDTNLTHDQKDMIPFMLEAGRVLKEDWGEELKIIASPWSPPKWMKKRVDNKPRSMLGSTPETCLRSGSEYAESWALYFSKFLTGYKNIGINLFAITIQNEPEFAAPWEACSYTPETELEFLNNHLGPRIKSDHPEVKILGFDHNKDHILTWSETLNSSPYLDGIGYHWYAGGMDRLLDGAQGTANLNGVSLGEGRFFLGTEGEQK